MSNKPISGLLDQLRESANIQIDLWKRKIEHNFDNLLVISDDTNEICSQVEQWAANNNLKVVKLGPDSNIIKDHKKWSSMDTGYARAILTDEGLAELNTEPCILLLDQIDKWPEWNIRKLIFEITKGRSVLSDKNDDVIKLDKFLFAIGTSGDIEHEEIHELRSSEWNDVNVLNMIDEEYEFGPCCGGDGCGCGCH